MMQIEHIGLWVQDLEKMKRFYERYFGAQAGELYENSSKGFKSYFLTFATGARLEIMQQPTLVNELPLKGHYAHLAFSIGSRAGVDELVAKLQQQGIPLLNGPRVTGDGYYEAVVEDPEHNQIELTV